jgi:hypothetical protein
LDPRPEFRHGTAATVQLPIGISGLSLRDRNAVLISDLYNIGQAIKNQIAKSNAIVVAFRKAVRPKPAAPVPANG